ncbi:hypothetical protein R6Q57_007849 [Mikania cordata]
MDDDDRLSGLQDDLIYIILSFVGIKDAIGTSVLSPRWRLMWTFIPNLSFSSDDFSTIDKLFDFVTKVLSRRNNQAQLSCVNFYIHGKDGHDFAQRILNHALSLNVQQVNLTCLFMMEVGLHLSISASHRTLKHLTLSSSISHDHIILTSTRELSFLTTLHLSYITLYNSFISLCPNLKNLALIWCKMMGSNELRICHPRLSNLTLYNLNMFTESINVVTPQLENLNITKLNGTHIISAPKLVSLLIRGYCPLMFSPYGFHSLEKAQLSFQCFHLSQAPKIISLLEKLHNVKVLSLCVDIIKLMNCSVELMSHQASPFLNLKSLKILPKVRCWWKHEHTRVIMSKEVKNYLLSSSPEAATVTEVLRDQCCDNTADLHSI